jgi:tetratricopeptide (TPR) repeat protein
MQYFRLNDLPMDPAMRSAWQTAMQNRGANSYFSIPGNGYLPGILFRVFRQQEGKMAMVPTTIIPLEAQYLYRLALDLSMEGKKEDALRYLKKVVFIAPRFSNAYNAMGNCLDELGRYEDAIRKYDKVLEIDPHHAEARFKRALVVGKILRSESQEWEHGRTPGLQIEPDGRRTGFSSESTPKSEFPFSLMRIGLNC